MNGIRISNVPHHLLPNSGRGSTRHLLAYLRAQLRHCVPYNRMKLMVVGLQGRGKTTLLSVLRTPNSPLPENVSTVGVVVNEWVVSPPAAITKRRGQQQKVSKYGACWTCTGVERTGRWCAASVTGQCAASVTGHGVQLVLQDCVQLVLQDMVCS